MSKFFGLVITPDLTLKRMWMDSNQAIAIIKEFKGCKVYRSTNDQEAVLIGEDGNEQLVWQDVQNVDKMS